MWKKLLEMLANGDVDEAVNALKVFDAATFESSVEVHTAMMTCQYEARAARLKFARLADTVAGHKESMNQNAWRQVAFNLNPNQGGNNGGVARSFMR